MKYGIYFAYWEQEWGVEQKKYIAKVKELGFDILEISCAMLKNISNQELLELKKMADDNGIILTAGYGPNDQENLASDNPEIVKHAINFYTD
ncbi:dolichol monophosphate mannose synthase, partial [Lachnotalea glycerini]